MKLSTLVFLSVLSACLGILTPSPALSHGGNAELEPHYARFCAILGVEEGSLAAAETIRIYPGQGPGRPVGLRIQRMGSYTMVLESKPARLAYFRLGSTGEGLVRDELMSLPGMSAIRNEIAARASALDIASRLIGEDVGLIFTGIKYDEESGSWFVGSMRTSQGIPFPAEEFFVRLDARSGHVYEVNNRITGIAAPLPEARLEDDRLWALARLISMQESEGIIGNDYRLTGVVSNGPMFVYPDRSAPGGRERSGEEVAKWVRTPRLGVMFHWDIEYTGREATYVRYSPTTIVIDAMTGERLK